MIPCVLRLGGWVLLLALLITLPIQVRGDAVLDWNSFMIDAIRLDNSGPTLSTRNLAILHTAIYDSVNSVLRTHQPYRFQMDAASGTSADAAAVGAAHRICIELYPSLQSDADDLLEVWRAYLPETAAASNGLALGERMAEQVLDDRAADGASTEYPYIPSSLPGQWRRTAPFFRPPVTPHWRYVTPFGLHSIDQFIPAPPPALDSVEYAEAFNEVKAIGGRASTLRTPEQTQIAVFWSDFSYTSMPPGHWHLIAETIAKQRGNTLAENARLFALLSIAQADAAVVCWEAKYRYNLWRPITAIQRAAEDGNPMTEAEKDWDHLLASPPFPAYTSGHSTFSKASAQILTHFYQTDSIRFDATSDSLPGIVRTFDSLSACADEVGMSRIYGGIHYRFDNQAGKLCGSAVGDFIYENYLHSNDALPFLRMESVGRVASHVRVHGHVGRLLHLEASEDLLNWESIASASMTSGGWQATDIRSSARERRFYRVREG